MSIRLRRESNARLYVDISLRRSNIRKAGLKFWTLCSRMLVPTWRLHRSELAPAEASSRRRGSRSRSPRFRTRYQSRDGGQPSGIVGLRLAFWRTLSLLGLEFVHHGIGATSERFSDGRHDVGVFEFPTRKLPELLGEIAYVLVGELYWHMSLRLYVATAVVLVSPPATFDKGSWCAVH